MVPWIQKSDVSVLDAGAQGLCKREMEQREKSGFEKQTSLKLGEYRGAALPLAILMFGYFCGQLCVSAMSPDPRVADWLFMDNSFVVITICITYVLSCVVWGPRIMKHRKAFRLKKTILIYNAFQVFLSAYMFIEVGLAGWFFEYSFFCQPCDYSQSPKGIRMASVGWLFFMSKMLDFVDTMFFILNKKWEQVSLLHIVHHSCMCISMWFGIKYTPGGHITFMGYLNSGVHAVMYTYYFLSALGPKMRPYLWWKKYLTTLQLAQFVIIFLHAAQLFVWECPHIHRGLAVWTCIYACIFFMLFIDFFYNAYLTPSQRKFLLSKGASPVKMESPVQTSPTDLTKVLGSKIELSCLRERSESNSP